MRLLIAMMKHETNTFSPVPTPLERFRPLYGDAAIRAYRGTGTGVGAYLDLAERERAEIVLPIAAGAPPSGPVEDAAYQHITDAICDAAARGGFNGIMLDLHGAMVTESLEDGEGEFLKRLRAIDPVIPRRTRGAPGDSARLRALAARARRGRHYSVFSAGRSESSILPASISASALRSGLLPSTRRGEPRIVSWMRRWMSAVRRNRPPTFSSSRSIFWMTSSPKSAS